MGASKVIAVVHRCGATDFVESLGADVVLSLTDGWAKAVRDHTDGRGVDIVVDPVGGLPSTARSGYWPLTASCWSSALPPAQSRR
jgi:NADPH:quinone reductase-like Zn-dependent oxidoreductase